jgi:hypothetical protein
MLSHYSYDKSEFYWTEFNKDNNDKTPIIFLEWNINVNELFMKFLCFDLT